MTDSDAPTPREAALREAAQEALLDDAATGNEPLTYATGFGAGISAMQRAVERRNALGPLDENALFVGVPDEDIHYEYEDTPEREPILFVRWDRMWDRLRLQAASTAAAGEGATVAAAKARVMEWMTTTRGKQPDKWVPRSWVLDLLDLLPAATSETPRETPLAGPLDVAAIRRWVGLNATRWSKYPSGTTVVDAEALDDFLAAVARGSE